MDIVLKRFLNMVEEELSKKETWLPEEERLRAAELALHLFVVEKYSTESAAVEDTVAHADGKMKNFEMKLKFQEGKINVNYLDGTDIEIYAADSLDDVLEKISDVIEVTMALDES